MIRAGAGSVRSQRIVGKGSLARWVRRLDKWTAGDGRFVLRAVKRVPSLPDRAGTSHVDEKRGTYVIGWLNLADDQLSAHLWALAMRAWFGRVHVRSRGKSLYTHQPAFIFLQADQPANLHAWLKYTPSVPNYMPF